jgi:IPT/TIG domain-containing protein
VSTTLARKFRVDVTSDLTLAASWLQLNGIDDWNPNVNPTTEDTSAYDTSGWTTNEVTMQAWSATASVFRRLNAGVYDPGQELCRATVGQFGTAARVGVRWYDKNGGPEAYSGVALVGWARNNTAVTNVEKATITFTNTDIPLNLNISNPGVAAVAAVVLAAAPSAVAVGGIVNITGVGFSGTTGATGVKFGATNATSYIVVSDNTIVAVMPAGSAGSAAVTVTNPVGASNVFPYTRGA